MGRPIAGLRERTAAQEREEVADSEQRESRPTIPSAMAFNVLECTIAQLHAAYLDGSTTARVVTQTYLDRIDAYDRRGPYLNSLIAVNRRALEVADQLDSELRTRGSLSGPLHGIPIIVKDNSTPATCRPPRASRCSGTSSHRAMPSSSTVCAPRAPSSSRKHRFRSCRWVWPIL